MRYEEIKEFAREHNVRVTDLIALTRKRDPFYAGTPSDYAKGEWFAELWRRFGYSTGVHIRRVHYQVISQERPVLMTDGRPYENTEGCWEYLNEAANRARYLGLVDPAAFIDQRNPDVKIFTPDAPTRPGIAVDDNLYMDDLELPPFPDLPEYSLVGGSLAGMQRYHIEVWCEKSTMNDVLVPLCSRYGVNLQTAIGEMSITGCLDLVKRATERPVRILYISDFDPAGQSMPTASARKIEWFTRANDEERDIRVYPIVLTADQVRQYQLPRTPIKETEKRAGRFEARFGEGAVELDALEALRPGVFRAIVNDEILRYYDLTLQRRADAKREELEDDLTDARHAALDSWSGDIDRVRSEYESIRIEFRERIAGIKEATTALWAEMVESMELSAPDIDNYPTPEAKEAVERENALLDTTRGYLEQIDAYKSFQGKEAYDAVPQD